MNRAAAADRRRARALRGTVLAVALLNGAYLVVEIILALGIGSVALVADSVDFFEDFAVNLLIFVALGWTAARQAVIGKVMAGIIVLPAVAALVMAATKIGDPEPPAAPSSTPASASTAAPSPGRPGSRRATTSWPASC